MTDSLGKIREDETLACPLPLAFRFNGCSFKVSPGWDISVANAALRLAWAGNNYEILHGHDVEGNGLHVIKNSTGSRSSDVFLDDNGFIAFESLLKRGVVYR